MFDVIAFGDINADIITEKVEKIKEGEQVIKDISIEVGGSAANFSRFIAAIGNLKVALLCKIPDNFLGRYIVEKIKKSGVSLIGKKVNDCGITIAINFENDRSFITYRGNNKLLSLKDFDLNKLRKLLKKAKHFHRAGFWHSELMLENDENEKLLSLASLYTETSLDIGFDEQGFTNERIKEVIKLLPFVDVFFVNEMELRRLTKKKDIFEAAKLLRKKVNLLVVHLGREGCLLVKRKKIIKFDAFPIERVKNFTGAGDAFNAAFIYGYIKGYPLEDCCKMANFVASSYISLGKIPKEKEIKEELKL